MQDILNTPYLQNMKIKRNMQSTQNMQEMYKCAKNAKNTLKMHNTGHFSHPGRPGHPGKPHHPGHPDCLVTLVILTTVVTLFQCKGRTCQVQLGLVYSGLPQVMLVHPTSEVRPPPALKRSGTVPAGSTGGHQGIS